MNYRNPYNFKSRLIVGILIAVAIGIIELIKWVYNL